MNSFDWFQRWFESHCDGDWEHGEGIKLQSLDNPGWMLTVDLDDTDLEDRPFQRVQCDRSESDWIHCWVEDGRFEGRCGPLNLGSVLESFRVWAEAQRTRS